MVKRTTKEDFDLIATAITNYLKSVNEPVVLSQVHEHFKEANFMIDPGRVILELAADRVLYFTEDWKIAVCTNQPTN